MDKKSCHQKCPYDKYCYKEGEDRSDFPDECSQYYKIEDLLMEARDERMKAKWRKEQYG